MKKNQAIGIAVFCAALCSTSFGYAAKHVIILVMDGARYTETWGDATHANIPNIARLAPLGAMLTHFRTNVPASSATTETNPGHARLTTGTVQNILNDGTVIPTQPSIFQQYIKQTGATATSCWVITSKDKLWILSNSSATGWNNLYRPSFSSGVNGDGTGGYREDNVTQPIVIQKLIADKPALMIVNYKGPDAMGHAANWAGYLAAIREVDGYVKKIWDTIQATVALKDSTALFIVNDHGRHTTDYTSHGDACEGCCHLLCLALGSNIRVGMTDTITREQRDFAPTIAKLLGFAMSTSTGAVMSEILDTGATTGISVKGISASPVFSVNTKAATYDISGRKICISDRTRSFIISTTVSNGTRTVKKQAPLK